MKLKTLNDLAYFEALGGNSIKDEREASNFYHPRHLVNVEELKAEAIKWVNGLLYLEKNGREHKPSQEFMHFFNITEEDLK